MLPRWLEKIYICSSYYRSSAIRVTFPYVPYVYIYTWEYYLLIVHWFRWYREVWATSWKNLKLDKIDAVCAWKLATGTCSGLSFLGNRQGLTEGKPRYVIYIHASIHMNIYIYTSLFTYVCICYAHCTISFIYIYEHLYISCTCPDKAPEVRQQA